ncbi:MAG: DUF3007 family protein [Cyanobacteria bacterium P01_H01_bin.15]
MRRIDVIWICLGVFGVGAIAYGVLKAAGIDGLSAGVWSQLVLVLVVVGWTGSYLLRVGSKSMTLNEQLKDYEEAVLDKRLAEMTPEEIAQLQAEVEAQNSQS